MKLEDLPEDVRSQFGYDPVKSAAADAAEEKQETQVAAAQQQQIAAAVQQAQGQTGYDPGYSGGSGVGGCMCEAIREATAYTYRRIRAVRRVAGDWEGLSRQTLR